MVALVSAVRCQPIVFYLRLRNCGIPMSKSNEPTILITGATDGIGLALARHYHALGARLILVGRRALEDLDDTLFADNTYCHADLSHPDCATQVISWLDEWQIEQL